MSKQSDGRTLKVRTPMQIHYYVGIDVSKNTLDWAVYNEKHIVWQAQSENTPAAIRTVIKQPLRRSDPSTSRL